MMRFTDTAETVLLSQKGRVDAKQTDEVIKNKNRNEDLHNDPNDAAIF